LAFELTGDKGNARTYLSPLRKPKTVGASKQRMAGVAFSVHYRPSGIEYSPVFDMPACKIMKK
jgi:hypothetical protein